MVVTAGVAVLPTMSPSTGEEDQFPEPQKILGGNIPSAKEIEEEGIGLGDLSHKQMEKIEELTLYIIELDERLKLLEKENALLKEKANLEK